MKDNECPKHVKKVLDTYKDDFPEKFMKSMYEMCDEDTLEERFYKIDEKSDEMDENEKERLETENHNILDDFEEKYNEVDDKIFNTKHGKPIYRGLTINNYEDFIKNLPQKNAGIYWTWDKDCARETGECGHHIDDNLVILKGVNPSDIDEEGTHLTNINFDNEEKEIRLNDESHIIVEEICRHKKNKKDNIEEICEPFGKRVRV